MMMISSEVDLVEVDLVEVDLVEVALVVVDSLPSNKAVLEEWEVEWVNQ